MEIKNLCKSYKDTVVYQGFDLSVTDGEVTCILGESGSGKTTLLNCIARLIDFSGEITPVKCSYVFQEPRLVPNLTVYGNLALVTSDKEEIQRALEAVQMDKMHTCYPKTLSGGQARRVAIARAFAVDSETVLMDEPFSSLDLRLKADIIEVVAYIQKNSKRTVIFVTHDIDEAVALADRIIVISGGKIIADERVGKTPPVSLGENNALRQKLIGILMGKQ